MKNKRGNCYVTCEALYHLLGGKKAGYMPMCMQWEGDTHWFLIKKRDYMICNSIIIDPTASQFKTKPDYSLAKGKGFLTKKPSKRAKTLMQKLLWQ